MTPVSMQVLGSLELLGNPTGLLYALSQGMHDLVAMPLEAESAGQARTILLWNRHTYLLKYSLGVDHILVPVFLPSTAVDKACRMKKTAPHNSVVCASSQKCGACRSWLALG